MLLDLHVYISFYFIHMEKEFIHINNVVTMNMEKRRLERLCDSLALRLSKTQRGYLEARAERDRISLAEAARSCIYESMKHAGVV